ncbi:MAG: class I SAM-dependent methyltransferase [Actinomycetia bacterium]|nr:class I SAM-dependent methyltransferase [Actinomycetes bacterium]
MHGCSIKEQVRFRKVDVTEAGWTQGLLDAGFNPAAKTIVLWERSPSILTKHTSRCPDEADFAASLSYPKVQPGVRVVRRRSSTTVIGRAV